MFQSKFYLLGQFLRLLRLRPLPGNCKNINRIDNGYSEHSNHDRRAVQ